MKVARAGPTRQASLSSKSCERPGTVDSTPTLGRAAVRIPQAHSRAC
jgi:hypothetical protein